jgi:TIR domain
MLIDGYQANGNNRKGWPFGGEPMKRFPFVETIENFKANLNYLNANTEAYRKVATPGSVAAWYATRDARNPSRWLFGPSRFIGYQGMRAEHYGSGEIYVHGSETERYLQGTGWFTTLDATDALHEQLCSQLTEFLAKIDAVPRREARINVLTTDLDYNEKSSGHVFISYAKATPEPTKKLAAQLEKLGYKVWWDTQLISGEAFNATIKEQLDTAAAVIVIWTKSSVGSLFVQSEASRALRSNKIVATMVPGLDIDDLPMPFDQLQTVDVNDIEKIIDGLKKHGVTS